MALARYQFTVQDQEGNAVPLAEVEVRQEALGLLPQLYSDRNGVTTLGNPFTADADGFAAFHVAGGAYKITVRHGDQERVYRYVGIGTASEVDLPPGSYASRRVTASGDVEVQGDDIILVIDKDAPEDTNVNLPPAIERDGRPVIIKKARGGMDSFTVTPVSTADPAELADGEALSAWRITTPAGFVRFEPLPDGSGWMVLGSAL